MSYDIMVIDRHHRFKNCKEFLSWYENVMQWKDEVEYNDYRHATENVQQWFLEMKDVAKPLNGEFAPTDKELGDGEQPEADYCIGKDFIYVALAFSDVENTCQKAFELAKKYGLAFFDISGTGELYYPDGRHFLPSPQQKPIEKHHWWQVNKILYPPLILIGFSLPIYVYAIIDRTPESVIPLCICTILLLFVLWKSMDNFWINHRLPVMSPKYYRTLNVIIDTPKQTGEVFDKESGISFSYNAKEKMLYVSKVMYTNPKRHLKEYEERKYQFQTRMEQTRIPLKGWISPPESPNKFHISIRIKKNFATPENIRILRDVFVELSKDDYVRQPK